jgi:hypothetical protein
MRASLIITLTFFLSFTTRAQGNVDLKEIVGFGCYYDGKSTRTVIKVTKLLQIKRYEHISKLLTSKNKGEKYLAVISLQRLADIGHYQLSDIEKSLISQAKLSDDLVSVCSGCTYFEKVPMKNILAEKDFIGSSYWLDRSIKEE